MSKAILLEKPPQLNIESTKTQDSFLQELLEQIHLTDTCNLYDLWSDELLIDRLIISLEKEEHSSKNLNLDPLNQLLTTAFYKAIASSIASKTGQNTEAFVHLRDREFSSAVIFCGGVLVLYSLIWGYRSFGFISLQELIESAETSISNAITKASRYLDL
ncbi:DUF269 domain-containing protein [Pleurocapsales cyanobacterium LEGE 10410]|nr:DUF269 domain-containing protein [Pleurocapsales cyanobacterium LEGE 10410]